MNIKTGKDLRIDLGRNPVATFRIIIKDLFPRLYNTYKDVIYSSQSLQALECDWFKAVYRNIVQYDLIRARK